MTGPFRVLSLSGGGMRGVFSAAVLCELQAALRQHTKNPATRLVDHFDLIVGTSTGGLLALGLAFGKDPSELLDCYKNLGPRVFPPWWKNPRCIILAPWLRPLFSQDRLREIVNAVVPSDKKLGDAAVPLVLTAVRRETGEPACLKTGHNADYFRDLHMSAVEAAMATTAAPVAFPHAATQAHGDLIDGGLWANTPALVGVVEACRGFGRRPEDVRLVSVGTTRAKLPPRARRHTGGTLEYGGMIRGRLPELLWEGQRSLAISAVKLILPPGAMVEIDHEFSGRGYSLMDSSPRALRALEQAGRMEAQKSSSMAIDMMVSTSA
ncbi:MAG: patatin-like phospholipase family protein [Phycisphaerales bacterium]|nr:patatin-like phospholipase family protein [Phycisphaerales bacterium]